MHDRHWTDDELLSKLFDVGPDNRHLENCIDCGRRWKSIKQKYDTAQLATGVVTEEKLAVQRRSIHARLETRSRKLAPILAPSLAAALLLLLGVFIFLRPEAPKQPAPAAVVEDRVMEEIFQVSFSAEPAAIEPVQSLFEEVQ